MTFQCQTKTVQPVVGITADVDRAPKHFHLFDEHGVGFHPFEERPQQSSSFFDGPHPLTCRERMKKGSHGARINECRDVLFLSPFEAEIDVVFAVL